MSIFNSNASPSRPFEGQSDEANFQEKTFLVVDDIVGMRTSMRITISTFGGVRIDMAGNANDAIYKIEHKAYDIILCDYDLGSGKDGQQLLEEIKRRKLIKSSVIFMMVTAEQRYEKVVSAVEMAPDDYLIKPFTGEILRTRPVAPVTRGVAPEAPGRAGRMFLPTHRHGVQPVRRPGVRCVEVSQ